MLTFPMLTDIEVNLFVLVFIGLGAGALSGFTGASGAFLVTPALIVLGFPANFAVGTSLAWVVGSAIIATLRHRKLGNVDIKLGLVMLFGTMPGMEVGVRILNRAKDMGLSDEVVLSISIFILLIVGIYTLCECIARKKQLDQMLAQNEGMPPAMKMASLSQKFHDNMTPKLHFVKSGVTVSLWIILGIGFFTGMLAGFIGIGGGFIMVPSLIYLIGLPSLMAVGTSLFQIIFSAAYGSIRHAISGNVIIFAALIMLAASSAGVQFGVFVTRYVRGISARFILAISVLICAVGAILKLASVLLEEPVAWLEVSSIVVTFSGIGIGLILICALFTIGFRCSHGQHIPTWLKPFVASA